MRIKWDEGMRMGMGTQEWSGEGAGVGWGDGDAGEGQCGASADPIQLGGSRVYAYGEVGHGQGK